MFDKSFYKITKILSKQRALAILFVYSATNSATNSIGRRGIRDWIDRLKQQAYQEGKFISIGICDPGGVVPINHWIWYDFNKRKPVMSRTYPSGHIIAQALSQKEIPEAFLRQLAVKQSPVSSSPSAGIRLSSSSLGSNIPEEQCFAHGSGIPDDFKHFLELPPPRHEHRRGFAPFQRRAESKTATKRS